MVDEPFEREVLRRVGLDRRTFVRNLVLGTAFAAPVLSSFDMRSLTQSAAVAGVANQCEGLEDVIVTYTGPTSATIGVPVTLTASVVDPTGSGPVNAGEGLFAFTDVAGFTHLFGANALAEPQIPVVNGVISAEFTFTNPPLTPGPSTDPPFGFITAFYSFQTDVEPICGVGRNSALVPFELLAGSAPGAPTGVVPVAIGSGRLDVRFTPPASAGSSPIDLYTVKVDGAIAATGTQSPIPVTGLTNATTVAVTVFAHNSAGDGPESSPAVQARVGVPYGPTAVLAATGPTKGSVVVNWNTPQSNGSPVSSFAITAQGTGGKTVGAGSSARSVTITGLQPGKNYHCFVAAKNAAGTGPTFAATPLVVKAKP